MIPRATYRLQLHKGFDFDAARAVLPYLQLLGISHVYCSPIMRSRPGSQHGYDVVDPAQIDPELGGREGFLEFARAARTLGMGLLLDLVPNHMGVFGADNAWWMDVLEHGQASEFAGFFDIDWLPANPALAGKLLVPVLGQAYGEVLDRGEIRLACDAAAGVLALHYHEHRFPLDPRSYAGVLEAAARLPEAAAEAGQPLRDLARACALLPPRETPIVPQRPPRGAACLGVKQRLAAVLREGAGAAAALAAEVEAINAEPGRERLHALHELQAYRLADWRMAADEINYRRFFDINELAALRIEDQRVFEAVQGPALDLAAAGWVDGFRIDHPDGLLDPAGYFERLQQGLWRRLPGGSPQAGAKAIYVVAEKITAAHEDVPRDWAIHGTTGYRFSNLANGLFVERRHAQRMQRIWRDFSGETEAWPELVRRCKRLVAHGTMAAQLTTLTRSLQRIALADRRTRDYGFDTLRDALAEVAAAMPVYRSYVVHGASAQDTQFIDWAVAQARQTGHALPPALFDFVRRCLLVQPASEMDAPQLEAVRAFAMAFQQFCAPLAAKGIEDTAFYRWHRLVSLNEVGGDPATFGVSASAFHGASRDRQAHWPHTMLATSTHDNKRSEDVRCRIDVLSEKPAAWRLALRRWKTQTRSWRCLVDGELAPSAADGVLLLQTLLGTLPAEGLDADHLDTYRRRIEAYMLKAAREAKQHTNWVFPNAAYEAALLGLVRGVLARIDGNPVLADLQAKAQRLAWFGALNSLALTVLKFASPGVPDLYQGSELVELSLVDPDNRRPVDYALRQRLLAELLTLREGSQTQAALAALARTPADGRLKLWLAWRLLALRQADPALLREGRYVALRVAGARRRHVIAFARRSPHATLLVMAGRKFAGLGAEPGMMPVGDVTWSDTQVRRPDWLAPQPLRGFDVLNERELEIAPGPLPLAEYFVHFPVSALLIETGARPPKGVP